VKMSELEAMAIDAVGRHWWGDIPPPVDCHDFEKETWFKQGAIAALNYVKDHAKASELAKTDPAYNPAGCAVAEADIARICTIEN